MLTFSIDSMIRGYHEYKVVWKNPNPGDHLICEREIGNPPCSSQGNVTGVDSAGVVSTTTRSVGHIPRMISAAWWNYILHGKWSTSFLCRFTTR